MCVAYEASFGSCQKDVVMEENVGKPVPNLTQKLRFNSLLIILIIFYCSLLAWTHFHCEKIILPVRGQDCHCDSVNCCFKILKIDQQISGFCKQSSKNYTTAIHNNNSNTIFKRLKAVYDTKIGFSISVARGPITPIEMPLMIKMMTAEPIISSFQLPLAFSVTTVIIKNNINIDNQGP